MTPVTGLEIFTESVLQFEPFQRQLHSLVVDSITTCYYRWHVQLDVKSSSWWFRGVIQGIKCIIIITEIEFSLSPYSNTDKTSKNKYI